MTSSTASIPAWNSAGVLPPIRPNMPGSSPDRSPYVVDLAVLLDRFATSPERAAILDGLLRFRADLHAAGITSGFQWLDGSFLEQVEALEGRAPRDMDVVTFLVHPRAVKKVHDFLELLVQQQAWCGLEFGDRFFRYADYEQIKASCERLKDENIQEREETYQGEFQGILPTGRTFEFQPSDREGVIRGKVDLAIADPDVLNREWLHKPVTVKLNVMQVGQGRPRFTLMTLDALHE